MTSGAPPVTAAPVVSLTGVVDVTVPVGVRVVAVRRPSVPMVQLRLHVPLEGLRISDAAVLAVLPKALMAGSGDRSASEVAAAAQRIGAFIGTSADFDHIGVWASAPSHELGEVLAQMADVLARPAFPARDVAGERERVVQDILQESADPLSTAGRALDERLFPRHPYSDPLPSVSAVRRTGPSALARFHQRCVVIPGSVLAVVGDLEPARVADLVEEAFGRWPLQPAPSPSAVPGQPQVDGAAASRPSDERAITVIHRPGAVQSNVRVGTRCASRHHDEFAALQLAVTVFGGNFSSRLVANLRERNGYTYTPRAAITEHRHATSLAVAADVSTSVTAPALMELDYELARIATLPVGEDELEAARRYVTGMLAMATATQSGLASMLGRVVAYGLEPAYLERYARQLAEADVHAVQAAAARYLGPAAMSTVVLGDAEAVAPQLEPLGAVRVRG